MLLQGRYQEAEKLLCRAPIITYGTPGQADIQGIADSTGRYLAIEVKRKGGKQSVDQILWMKMFIRYGGFYVLAYSLNDVINKFSEIGIEKK